MTAPQSAVQNTLYPWRDDFVSGLLLGTPAFGKPGTQGVPEIVGIAGNLPSVPEFPRLSPSFTSRGIRARAGAGKPDSEHARWNLLMILPSCRTVCCYASR